MIRLYHKYLGDGSLAFTLIKSGRFFSIKSGTTKSIIYSEEEFLTQIEILEGLIKKKKMELSLNYSETPGPLKTMEFIKNQSVIIYNDIIKHTEQLSNHNDSVDSDVKNNLKETDSPKKSHNPWIVTIVGGIIVGVVIIIINNFFTNHSQSNKSIPFSKDTSLSLIDTSSSLAHDEPVKEVALKPLSIFTRSNLNKSDQDEFLKEIRKIDNVREISALESGKQAKELPDKIYSFVSLLALSSEGSKLKEFFLTVTTTRFNMTGSDFEVHYINKDKIILIGFASEKEASDISYLSGKKLHTITLSPVLLKYFNSLIAIPIDRITYCNDRTIEISNLEFYDVLDVKIR